MYILMADVYSYFAIALILLKNKKCVNFSFDSPLTDNPKMEEKQQDIRKGSYKFWWRIWVEKLFSFSYDSSTVKLLYG